MNAHNFWIDKVNQLRENLKGSIDSFATWDCVSSTMIAPDTKFILNMWENIKNNERLLKIKEVDFGNIPRISKDYSSNLIQGLYQVWVLEQVLKNVSKFDTVLEFGGGFGNMRRLFWELGHSGRYIIYDFPEFNSLQEKFLTRCGINNTEYCNDVSKLERPDLLISFYGISEAPYDLRDKFFNLKPSNTFVCFGPKFEDIDNINYFSKIDNDDIFIDTSVRTDTYFLYKGK